MAQSRWLNNKQDAYWQLSNDNDLNSSAITQNPCRLYGFFLLFMMDSILMTNNL